MHPFGPREDLLQAFEVITLLYSQTILRLALLAMFGSAPKA